MSVSLGLEETPVSRAHISVGSSSEIMRNSPQPITEDLENRQSEQELRQITIERSDSKAQNDAVQRLSGKYNSEGENEDGYPHGLSLAIVTLGIMAFILMVALDNYILGLLHVSTSKPKIKTR